nr:putative 26 kDa protein [Fig virus B]
MLSARVIPLIMLVYVIPTKTDECPYNVEFINGTKLTTVAGSTQFECNDIKNIEISNLPHEACRIDLVNVISSKTVGINTLIETTSRSGILYYDISLVDGLTCLPSELYEEKQLLEVFPKCDSYRLCGESVCKSECSATRDVHECELEKPYTTNWEKRLRMSCITEDTRVYSSAYDDHRGLRTSYSDSIRYAFHSKDAKIPRLTNHATSVQYKRILRIITILIIFNCFDIN